MTMLYPPSWYHDPPDPPELPEQCECPQCEGTQVTKRGRPCPRCMGRGTIDDVEPAAEQLARLTRPRGDYIGTGRMRPNHSGS